MRIETALKPVWKVGWCELIERAAENRKRAACYPIGSAWYREHVNTARACVRAASARRDQPHSI